MNYGFDKLESEYQKLFSVMEVNRQSQFYVLAKRLVSHKNYYENVSAKAGVPIVLLMALNEREDDENFNDYLGNGDPLNRITRDVPKGRGPFDSWDSGAIDALTLEGMTGITGWTWALMAYWAERWNGWGYRQRGINTPYLWAGTNVYQAGKYTSDGHFNSIAVDRQPGVIPLMCAIVALDASLGVPGWPALQIPQPEPVPEEFGSAIGTIAWVQAALNKIDDAGLRVDGSNGRLTRAAVKAFQATYGLAQDGIAGPLTADAIKDALAKLSKPRMAAAAPVAASSVILDRDVAELCRGAYAYTGDAAVTWDYVDDGAETGVPVFIKEVNGVSVVVFPGTQDIPDCLRDLEAWAETPEDGTYFGPVHRGGNKGVSDAVTKLYPKLGQKSRLIVAGHSLGAMRADNAIAYLIEAGRNPLARVVFGEPRPGFQTFADYIKSVPARAYRNEAGLCGDPVTCVPFKFSNLPYVHPCQQTGITVNPDWNDLWGPVAPHRMQYYSEGLKAITTGTAI